MSGYSTSGDGTPALAPGRLVVSVDGQRWRFAPGSSAVVGRGVDCQVVLSDTRVSRRHLELVWENDSWFVRDLGSANGTFQDGRPLTNEPVGAARAIRLGHATEGPLVELIVEGDPSPPLASPPPQQASPPPQQASPPPQQASPPPQQASPPPQQISPPPQQASPPPQQISPPASPAPPQAVPPQPVPQQQIPHQPVPHQPVPHQPAPQLRYQVGTATPPAAPPAPSPPTRYGAPGQPAPPPPRPPAAETAIRLTGSVRIGRDVDNDLVLADLLVSRRHARIDTVQYGFQVVDLGSSNKTFVNGVPIAGPTLLPDGAMLTVGRTRFVQNQGVLREIREERVDELAVEHVTFTLPDGKTLTNNVSLRLSGPKLVAVLGPSGAGKSTLLHLIAGENEPTGGQVRYQNVDVHTHYAEVKSRIGMVPQHTVAHSRLTARYALRYAAQLRLSGDVTEAERERRVDQVLGELGLSAHADTRVDRLSGGQQRRLAIGFELLTRTSLLLLDEPTSGLDPALAYEVMRLLRRLADEGRQVVVTTHDTAHLDMCDTVVAMANGGTLAYVGPPDAIANQFGTSKWPEIFTMLAAPPARPPQPLPPGGRRPRRPAAPPAPSGPGRGSGSRVGRQFGVLVRRQLRLTFSDARYAAFLGLMPVALAVLALIVTDADGLGPGQGPVPPELELAPNPAAMRLVLVLIVGALFTGMASSVRELVGERPIYQYERRAGLTAEAYLLSKLLIFATVAVIQSVLLVGVVRLFRPGPHEAILFGFGTLEVMLAVAATAVVSSVLGLLVSSLMTTVEQTMPPLVVAVMAQLVLSGGLGVEVSGRPVLEQISWLAPARWGYASAAGTIDLTALAPNGPDDPLWSHHPAVLLGSMAALSVMAVGFALLTLKFVRRK